MELDLEDGDPVRAEMSPAERRRIAREATAESQGKATRSRGTTGSRPASKTKQVAAQREDSELASKLGRVFDRIAKALESRGDDELASVVREDSQGMEQGLVSLTHSVKFLRLPLLMILNFVEPVLAFGRIARILFGRWNERAARVRLDREYSQQEQQAAEAVQ